MSETDKSVRGTPLKRCSEPGMPVTGYARDGICNMGDLGSHHVCLKDLHANDGAFCKVTGQGNWCKYQKGLVFLRVGIRTRGATSKLRLISCQMRRDEHASPRPLQEVGYDGTVRYCTGVGPRLGTGTGVGGGNLFYFAPSATNRNVLRGRARRPHAPTHHETHHPHLPLPPRAWSRGSV